MELDWADGRGITRVWQKGKVSPYDFKSNPSKYDRGFKNNNACGYLCYGHGGKDACDNGWECGGVWAGGAGICGFTGGQPGVGRVSVF